MKDLTIFVSELRDAEDAIKEALSQLDETRKTCAACGLGAFADWDEHQMAEQLRGALGRCERARKTIAHLGGAP